MERILSGRKRGGARRRLAVGVALVALVPWALIGQRSHSSGSMGLGSGYGWNVSFHPVSQRSALVLAAVAAALWLGAAVLWVHPSRPTTIAAGGLVLAAAVAGTIYLAGRPAVVPGPSQAAVSRLRLGEREATVIAALGPAPDLGTATTLASSESLPCLVYPLSGLAVCFRDGRLAINSQAQ